MELYKVMGAKGIAAWEKGEDWREYARNYFKQEATSRLNNDIINISGALNPGSEKADAFAHKYYASVRKMSTDCKRIAEHSKIDIELVKKAKKHLFMTKHNLYGDSFDYFYPDYEIAQSWQRLSDKNRKIEPHDLILIQHEALESKYMSMGYSQKDAHEKANLKYNYQSALSERVEKNDLDSKENF